MGASSPIVNGAARTKVTALKDEAVGGRRLPNYPPGYPSVKSEAFVAEHGMTRGIHSVRWERIRAVGVRILGRTGANTCG